MSRAWLGALGVTVAIAGCAPPTAPPPIATPSSTPAASVSPQPLESAAAGTPTGERTGERAGERTAMAVLATLPVKGRAPKTGYDRDLFGQAWADVDRNGCDTRNDVLRRDLTGETFRPGTRDCVVVSGQLADPYTATTITFTKADAGAVQIDHVVSLSDAWQKGAQQWDPGKRLAFANDPLNLLAVDGPANASKSDGDAATWLPPNTAYRCAMVARQTAVKASYGLWVTAAEREAIAGVLSSCPTELTPISNTRPTGALSPAAPATPNAPPPSAPPKPKVDTQAGVDPDYGTCKEAKANGAGPYVRGRDVEYEWYRDGDSDGTVCE
ncbi:MAG: DUF1524 domain-containing protein [Gemmatimonadetes bacterium]|nr:DUF1524 domain-containing protein [Gemmatimonadota bacterium]